MGWAGGLVCKEIQKIKGLEREKREQIKLGCPVGEMSAFGQLGKKNLGCEWAKETKGIKDAGMST